MSCYLEKIQNYLRFSLNKRSKKPMSLPHFANEKNLNFCFSYKSFPGVSLHLFQFVRISCVAKNFTSLKVCTSILKSFNKPFKNVRYSLKTPRSLERSLRTFIVCFNGLSLRRIVAVPECFRNYRWRYTSCRRLCIYFTSGSGGTEVFNGFIGFLLCFGISDVFRLRLPQT